MRHYAPNARVIPLEMSEHTGDERRQRWLHAVQEQLDIWAQNWRPAAFDMAVARGICWDSFCLG